MQTRWDKLSEKAYTYAFDHIKACQPVSYASLRWFILDQLPEANEANIGLLMRRIIRMGAERSAYAMDEEACFDLWENFEYP